MCCFDTVRPTSLHLESIAAYGPAASDVQTLLGCVAMPYAAVHLQHPHTALQSTPWDERSLGKFLSGNIHRHIHTHTHTPTSAVSLFSDSRIVQSQLKFFSRHLGLSRVNERLGTLHRRRITDLSHQFTSIWLRNDRQVASGDHAPVAVRTRESSLFRTPDSTCRTRCLLCI